MRMQARSRRIFDNLRVVDSQGNFMFYTTEGKANSYIKKNLAKWVQLYPEYVLQLQFKPKGNGCQDKYRRNPMPNYCVVCGTDQNINCHHIVPYCYYKQLGKHFPQYLRSGGDHVVMCIYCHEQYELHAEKLKKQICQSYGLPVSGYYKGFGPPKDSVRIYKLVHALSNCQLPEDIRQRTQQLATDLLGQPITPEMIENCSLKYYKHNNYHKSSTSIVEQIIATNQVDEFVLQWRQHFLDTMNPQFMPQHWTVDRPVFRSQQHLDEYR